MSESILSNLIYSNPTLFILVFSITRFFTNLKVTSFLLNNYIGFVECETGCMSRCLSLCPQIYKIFRQPQIQIFQ